MHIEADKRPVMSNSLWSKIFVFDPLHLKDPRKTGRNSFATASTTPWDKSRTGGHMPCDSQWWSHGMLRMNELSESVETGQPGCSGLLSIAHGLFSAWLLSLLPWKCLVASCFKASVIISPKTLKHSMKASQRVSLSLLSIGTTFFLQKSDIFHSYAGKRRIFLKRGWMGIVVPVAPRLLDWFRSRLHSQCLFLWACSERALAEPNLSSTSW